MTANDMPANAGPRSLSLISPPAKAASSPWWTLQTHPELLQVVEIVQFREAMSERGEDYQVAFIEGSCTRQSDEPRLQKDPPAGGGGGRPGDLRTPGRRQLL